MDLADFDYTLPSRLIAQEPTPERDGARLLVLERGQAGLRHARVLDLPELLRSGDLLVRNTTRVLPARLRGHKPTGGATEALLLGPVPGSPGRFRALLRRPGPAGSGAKLRFGPSGAGLDAELVEREADGVCVLAFPPGADPYAIGETPLPPYIRRDAARPEDAERYQTVYARAPGSVAAPTAGLHLSPRLLARLAERGVQTADLALEIGPGTFQNPSQQQLASGLLHAERFQLPEQTAAAIADARARGARVVAVGSTSARVLEARARPGREVAAGCGETRLFLRPGSRFQVVDALLTNFHLPGSSLLMLVAAFAGRERVLAAYAEAVRAGYRFYSYGDAMLLL